VLHLAGGPAGTWHFDDFGSCQSRFGRDAGELIVWARGLIGVDCRPDNRCGRMAGSVSVAILDEFIGRKS
jgi:hypothetical protein